MTINTERLYEKLWEIPVLDCHTHLNASHLAARGLHDVLLYHMVVSDLYSAGCPSGARLAYEAEAERRVLDAVEYLPRIVNTSCYWGVRLILRDLYGFNEPLTAAYCMDWVYAKSRPFHLSAGSLPYKNNEAGQPFWRQASLFPLVYPRADFS